MSDRYMIQNNQGIAGRPLYVKRIMRVTPPERSNLPNEARSALPNVVYTENPGDAMIFSYQELQAIDMHRYGSPVPAMH